MTRAKLKDVGRRVKTLRTPQQIARIEAQYVERISAGKHPFRHCFTRRPWWTR